jgi:hypothetical protein
MTLTDKIISLVEQAKSGVVHVVNSAMVCTNYLIGRLIVEEYQHGATRAEYGANILQNVSAELTQKLGKGYSVQNLERMRNFFLVYSKSSKELRKSEVFQKSSNSYYDRFVKNEHENPTIGIILCKNKNESLVEITLPEDKKQIFAAKYSTVLPQKSELKALLKNSKNEQ